MVQLLKDRVKEKLKSSNRKQCNTYLGKNMIKADFSLEILKESNGCLSQRTERKKSIKSIIIQKNCPSKVTVMKYLSRQTENIHC